MAMQGGAGLNQTPLQMLLLLYNNASIDICIGVLVPNTVKQAKPKIYFTNKSQLLVLLACPDQQV